jgi:hypothetical protein
MQSYFFEVCLMAYVYLKSVKGDGAFFFYNVYTEKCSYLCVGI